MSPSNNSHCHTIFVYGTLKRGFTNYERYLGIAESHGKASFVGSATTVDAYHLVVRPRHVLPPSCPPILMDSSAKGHQVHGEVYCMDDSTLEALDILEGIRTGYYYRRQVKVCLVNGKELLCEAYFYPVKEELLELDALPSYLAEHHALYRPSAFKEEIKRLCTGSHGLATSHPSTMTTHCLRLLPGEDIVLSLQRFATRNSLEAAVILSCVGSTAKTTLRPAGVPTPKVFTEKYEIVSLTGTVSIHGHHIHMSISDSDCNVFGGHVLEGCIVRTTAEIALGIIHGVRFTRPVDERTGYDELSILQIEATSDLDGAKRIRLDQHSNGLPYRAVTVPA